VQAGELHRNLVWLQSLAACDRSVIRREHVGRLHLSGTAVANAPSDAPWGL